LFDVLEAVLGVHVECTANTIEVTEVNDRGTN